MGVWDKLKKKEYWYSIGIIVGAIMFLEKYISSFIVSKLPFSLPALFITFISDYLIILIGQLILNSVWELN